MMPLPRRNCIGSAPSRATNTGRGGHSMSPVSIRFLIASALACSGLIATVAALAQPTPSATPAAQPTTPAAQPQPTPAATPAAIGSTTPGAPPSWQQGRTPEQSDSTLHPFAPQMTGRPASGL